MHLGYHKRVYTLLAHGINQGALCLVAFLYPIKESSLAYVVVNVRVGQNLGHLFECSKVIRQKQ